MKIKSIKLYNFKVFAGLNSMDLEGDKLVTIIGGMNGRGKTTILEAILLALYGKRSFLFLESKLSYPMYLQQLINYADGSYTARIALDIDMPVDIGYTSLTVIREWDGKSSTPSVKTNILNQGSNDPYLSDNWDTFIEDVLPSTIAPFFFFDGEKISGIASTNDDNYIGESIKVLLGINIVDTAIEDLYRILRKKRKPVSNDTINHDLEQYENELDNMDLLIKQAIEQAGLLETERINLGNKLKQSEDRFLEVGGESAVKLSEIRIKESYIREEIDRTDSELVAYCAGDLPMLMVRPLLERIYTAAKQESGNRELQSARQLLPTTLAKYCNEQGISFDIDGFSQYLAAGLNEGETVYQLSIEGMQRLTNLVKNDMIKSSVKIRHTLSCRHSLLAEHESIKNRLATKFNEDEAVSAQQQMLDVAMKLGAINDKYHTAQQTILDYHTQRQELSRKRSRLLENVLRNKEEIDEEERMSLYCNYSIEVFSEYRKQLLEKKTQRLAEVMCDCFQKIIAKDDLINRIVIDPQTLGFHYYNSKNHEIQLTMLSAGERQLLIIAMLWAIGLCSEKKFPLVIDTPLARLDSIHRTLLVQNFFPHASEQIIILSTDEEIYGDTYRALKPLIGKEYTLQYDPTGKKTTVLPGYFGGEKH